MPPANDVAAPKGVVKDLLPTFLDMAGIAVPTHQYAGKAIVPVTGVSLRTALQSASAVPTLRPPTESVAFEYLGQGYVNGPDGWKLSRTAVPDIPARTYADLPWKLFNTLEDRGETKDRSTERPDLEDALKKPLGSVRARQPGADSGYAARAEARPRRVMSRAGAHAGRRGAATPGCGPRHPPPAGERRSIGLRASRCGSLAQTLSAASSGCRDAALCRPCRTSGGANQRVR